MPGLPGDACDQGKRDERLTVEALVAGQVLCGGLDWVLAIQQQLFLELDKCFVVREAFPRFLTGAEASEGCSEGPDDTAAGAEEGAEYR